MKNVGELISELQASVTDPEKKQLAAAIATDLVRVGTLAVTEPERAESLMRALKAQTAGLAAAEASQWTSIVQTWIQRIAGAAIASAFA